MGNASYTIHVLSLFPDGLHQIIQHFLFGAVYEHHSVMGVILPKTDFGVVKLMGVYKGMVCENQLVPHVKPALALELVHRKKFAHAGAATGENIGVNKDGGGVDLDPCLALVMASGKRNGGVGHVADFSFFAYVYCDILGSDFTVGVKNFLVALG